MRNFYKKFTSITNTNFTITDKNGTPPTLNMLRYFQNLIPFMIKSELGVSFVAQWKRT